MCQKEIKDSITLAEILEEMPPGSSFEIYKAPSGDYYHAGYTPTGPLYRPKKAGKLDWVKEAEDIERKFFS